MQTTGYQSSEAPLDPGVAKHIVDVHCHPTDNVLDPDEIQALNVTICAMATRKSDQDRVRELANANPKKVIPCFGYHPWFSHHISLGRNLSKEQHYRRILVINEKFKDSKNKDKTRDASSEKSEEKEDDEIVVSSSISAEQSAALEKLLPLLPEPTPLEDIVAEMRQNLEAFPNAMVGEIGLDRHFRIPYDYHADPREMTPWTVVMTHQMAIVEAQIKLAVEYRRNISFHSVKANLLTLELIKRMEEKYEGRWLRINIDLHSCGISVESVKDIQRKHKNVYISFSKAINGRSSNQRRLISATDPKRLLAESDYHTLSMCTPQTWAIINTIARAKWWPIELQWSDNPPEREKDWGVVRRLEQNWLKFSTESDPFAPSSLP